MINYTKLNLILVIPPNLSYAIRVGDLVIVFPGAAGLASSVTRYYRCTSVNSLSKTWTGHKFIELKDLATGKLLYVLLSSSTTDILTYSDIIPLVGCIYTNNALVRVASLYTGRPPLDYVFYAPFSDSTAVTPSGHTLTHNNVSFTIQDGIACAYYSGAPSYTTVSPMSNIPYSALNRTTSIWFKVKFAQRGFLWMYGALKNNHSHGCWYIILTKSNGILLNSYYVDVCQSTGATHFDGNWHNLVITYTSGGYAKMYLDGNMVAEGQSKEYPSGTLYAIPTKRLCMYFGAYSYDTSACPFVGYMASAKIYDRILTLSLIKLLAQEHYT